MSEPHRECFTCSKIPTCSSVSARKISESYVCPLFVVAQEPVILARNTMLERYGLRMVIRMLMKRPTEPGQEEHQEMHIDEPTPGMTYSQRKKQLEIAGFMAVRELGVHKYKDENGQPILSNDWSLPIENRAACIKMVLDFELATNRIVPDAAQPQQEGVPQMAQAFIPPPPPGTQPQQRPMPQAPMTMPPPPPMMAQAPMQPATAPQPPFAGMPPPMPATSVPPPPATPQQAAEAAQAPEQPQTGKKRASKAGTAGTAVAPPPPPPPAPPGAMASPNQFVVPGAPQFQPGMPQMGMQPSWSMPTAPPVPQAPPNGTPSGLEAKIDMLGAAVNAVGSGSQEFQRVVQGQLAELQMLARVQVAALHHLYVTQPALTAGLQNQVDLGDAAKFIAFMQKYLPQ